MLIGCGRPNSHPNWRCSEVSFANKDWVVQTALVHQAKPTNSSMVPTYKAPSYPSGAIERYELIMGGRYLCIVAVHLSINLFLYHVTRLISSAEPPNFDPSRWCSLIPDTCEGTGNQYGLYSLACASAQQQK